MQKKPILNVLFIATIILLLYFIFTFMLLLYDYDIFSLVFNFLFKTTIGLTFFYFLAVLCFIFWIYCLRNAIKEADSLHFILLLFFNALYLPIYYLLKIRNIKNSHNK